MRITDQNAIKSGEKELIDAITGDLDWAAIERLFRKKYNLQLKDDINYKDGDMVIHENQIAYRLNFEVKVGFTVLFDRKGECIDLAALNESPEPITEASDHASQGQPPAAREDEKGEADTGADAWSKGPAEAGTGESVSQMASQLADMISDINKD